jgi:hypothetical protein
MRKFFLCMLLMTLLWVGSARMDEKCAAACSIADLGRVQECSARVRPRLKLNSLRGGAGAVATRIILDDSACSSVCAIPPLLLWLALLLSEFRSRLMAEATLRCDFRILEDPRSAIVFLPPPLRQATCAAFAAPIEASHVASCVLRQSASRRHATDAHPASDTPFFSYAHTVRGGWLLECMGRKDSNDQDCRHNRV